MEEATGDDEEWTGESERSAGDPFQAKPKSKEQDMREAFGKKQKPKGTQNPADNFRK